MSPTTKVLVCVGVSAIAKLAILKAIGHAARKQELKYTPRYRRPTS